MESIERDQPRISVNKLGEYVTAAPARRRRIIIDQKRPKNFIVPRYASAEENIVGFLTGSLDERHLLQSIEELEGRASDSEWRAQTDQLCAEAIGCFLDGLDALDLDGVDLRAPTQSPQPLKLGGIAVSVRPEASVTRVGGRSAKAKGLLKLYLGKAHPLDQASGAAIATCLRHYAEEASVPSEVDDRLCLVLDVFAGEVYQAPRAHKRRMRDVEPACEEIARAWPML